MPLPKRSGIKHIADTKELNGSALRWPLFYGGKGADAHQSLVASQKMSARHAQQVWWLPGTWVDITMRRPASPVAHAVLTGIEGVSIVLASFYGAMTRKGCALMVSKNTALLNFARYPFVCSVCNPTSTTKYRSRLDCVSGCA